MIDHIGINVRDIEHSKRFYEKSLAPFGYKVTGVWDEGVMLKADKDLGFLWLAAKPPDFWSENDTPGRSPLHLAFSAPSKQSVEEFHKAALASGGQDNGAPGPRPNYAPDYFAAFVIDPDGNNIEAVHIGE